MVCVANIQAVIMEQREVSPIRSGVRTASIIAVEDFANLAAQEGDGRLFKMEVDYTSQVDEALPKADAIAKSGNVAGALESLASLEKQTRLGSDMKSNSRVVQHMVKLCFEGSAWSLLNETIVMLSKKRSIIKLAIARMVLDVDGLKSWTTVTDLSVILTYGDMIYYCVCVFGKFIYNILTIMKTLQ
uniref:PMEI domain-containing protein n=1 Tax=Ascaris lumbricoides TaxID=6252 RepID=A0A0M3HWB4_ASCLU